MNILGLSADFHDSSASLVMDGRLVCSAAEERFSRIKHDARFPEQAAQFCLAQAGLHPGDLDRIVFYEQPWLKLTRVLTDVMSHFPRSINQFGRAGRSWLTQKLWIHNRISRTYDIHPDAVSFVPHHESHAAQAFYPSGFEQSAILTVDGVGEWTCTGIARGSRKEGITVLETEEYPNSVGLAYAAFTAFLGFKPNDGECSTMALAAFGQPVYAESVRRVLTPLSGGRYQLDPGFFNFFGESARLFTPAFIRLFGEPRRPADGLPFSCTGAAEHVSADHQRFADVAASIQLVFEEVMLGLARRAHALSGLDRLCLAGGAAMNAVAVTRLLREGPFDHVFVPPDPGDGGAATGAALLACNEIAATPPRPTPYLGKQYPEQSLAEAIPMLSIESHHRLPAARAWSGRLTQKEYGDEAALVEVVADDISRGSLVGWVQGRFEQGPRALGNRSILADPANAQAAGRLSRAVKQRAAFRPYALSLAVEEAQRLIPGVDLREEARTARWMQSVHPVNEGCVSSVRQALHVDSTTRPQICTPTDNGMYHKLLQAFGARRGTAALLNTSFNESGDPIVSSPAEALITFLHTDIDVLVLGMTVIRKVA